jgi:hypothetical protein
LTAAVSAAARQGWQAPTSPSDGKSAVDRVDVAVVEPQVAGTGVLFGVLDRRGFRDRERAGIAGEKRQDHLMRRRAVLRGNRLDRARTRSIRPVTAAERRVGDDRDSMLAAERQLVLLDGAFAQIVEHLVARDRLAFEGRLRLLEVGDVEVAHAERADLAVGDELLQRAHRLAQRHAAAPVEQIAIQVARPEPLERRFAGALRVLITGVRRQDLRDDEQLLARQPANRLADQPFRAAVTVHLRRIDVYHAELDAAAQRALCLVGTLAAQRDVPRALTRDRHLPVERTERTSDHGK